jgi:SpoVK/Ycf46/Vps4 family AAA+-type ATPase
VSRNDLLIQLVRAGILNDPSNFKRAVENLIAEERAQSHHVLAEKLEQNLRAASAMSRNPISGAADYKQVALVADFDDTKQLEDMFLSDQNRQMCEKLVEEQHRRDLLRSYNLEPRNRLLLIGPPGNGKTSLAIALSNSLMVPIFVVRYEALIGSFLGETAAALQRLFDYVRTRPCVLFFDEFDTIGKERGDTHETGEIKRVVSSLLLQIDKLPTHVVVVGATNHPELLDRAVWRRFQLHLELGPPDAAALQLWVDSFEKRLCGSLGAKLRALIVRRLKSASFADLELFQHDVQRRLVLTAPNEDLRKIVGECVEELSTRLTRGALNHDGER